MTEEIRGEISERGPISFERFMELALYGVEGFYTSASQGMAGRRGDFLTSPEVGPLFGALIARYLDAEWERIGRPDPFTVVDAGAGPGTLARSVVSAAPQCRDSLRYVAVEVSARQRSRHPEGVESIPALPSGPIDGVVIANELLDNLPFRLAVFDGSWREAFVDLDRNRAGRFVEVLPAPFESLPANFSASGRLGARVPVVERAARWVDDARSIVRKGAVLAIDYGVGTTAELAGRDWREWLRTYRDHERGGHYLADAGLQDITTEVPLDQLPEPDVLRTQSQFLQRWGIDELVREGVDAWTERAASPDLDAIRMRSRVGESEALLDSTGLGRFIVAEWTR